MAAFGFIPFSIADLTGRRPGRGYILAAGISVTDSAPVAMDSSRSAGLNEDDDAYA
jgi:hypothetical protein